LGSIENTEFCRQGFIHIENIRTFLDVIDALVEGFLEMPLKDLK
jgi:hypothetical protein